MTTALAARLVVGGLLLAGAAPKLVAQGRWGWEDEADRPRSAISLMAGIARVDEGADGTGISGAFRFDVPVGRYLIVEPGLGFLSYRSAVGGRIEYLMPEVSFQAQLPAGPIRPYAGAGLGFTEYLSGRGSTFVTLHAAGGARIYLGDWGVRGEARVRTIDPFYQTVVELTAGVTRRLGRGRSE